jgi:hypothetical protein
MKKHKVAKRERRRRDLARIKTRVERIISRDFYYSIFSGETRDSRLAAIIAEGRKKAESKFCWRCRCEWCFPDPSPEDRRSRISFEEEIKEVREDYQVLGFRL